MLVGINDASRLADCVFCDQKAITLKALDLCLGSVTEAIWKQGGLTFASMISFILYSSLGFSSRILSKKKLA